MDRAPDVSVIIPALELRPDFLVMLHRLAAQQGPSFEILVVLNQAERAIDAVLPEKCRLLFCPAPGSYAARNAGIGAARGRVLAFTDSDAEPSAGWLQEGYAAVETFDFNVIVAGAVQAFRRRMSAAGAYDLLFYLNQRHGVMTEGIAGTVNLWVPTRIMQSLGGFNDSMYSCGDIEFCQRARLKGFRLAFSDDAAVHHPARDRLFALLQKERRIAGGLVALARVQGSSGTLWYHAKRELDFFKLRAGVIGKLPRPSPRFRLQIVNGAVLGARICERMCVLLGKRPRRI